MKKPIYSEPPYPYSRTAVKLILTELEK